MRTPIPRAALRPALAELAPDVGSRPDVPIHLEWNESRWPLPSALTRKMTEAVTGVDPRPYPDRSYPAVREALGRLAGWDPEGIAFGNGGDDMLALMGIATTGPGRTGIHPSPGFSMYPWAIRRAGARPVPVPLGDDLAYDVDGLIGRIGEENPSLVFLTNPHNPTGQQLPLDEVRRIADAAPGFLLVDEAYHEFSAFTARPLLDEFGNVILLRTFSKAMALAGGRLGYVLGAPEAILAIRRAQPPFPVGIYTCRAGAAAMTEREALADLTGRIVAERESLRERLADIPGVRVWPSQTNFLLFHTPADSTVLARRLLARGVAVRDFSQHPMLAGTLRVTVGIPEENRVFLAALRDSLAHPILPEELASAGTAASPVG